MVFGRNLIVYQHFEEDHWLGGMGMTKASEFYAKHQHEIEFTEKLKKLMRHATKFDH
jgi:hypothetical protein